MFHFEWAKAKYMCAAERWLKFARVPFARAA